MPKSETKKQLIAVRFRPNQSAGQHFLLSEEILQRMVAAADLTPSDLVLEIGAGPGNLTRQLARAGSRVIAIESDHRLIPVWQKNLKDFPQAKIIADDIFHWRNKNKNELPDHGYKLVANLPYYLTARLLRVFLAEPPKPKLMLVMIQAEVAERITAQPGQMSLISVMVQYFSQPRILFKVPAENFWPSPEVTSAVVMIDQIKGTPPEAEEFFRLCRIGFSSRRKQLQNNLCAGLKKTRPEILARLKRINIKETSRPQELSLADWTALFQILKIHKK